MFSRADLILGLTAVQRWAAARRIGPRPVSQQWFVLIGIVVMLVLLVVLISISYQRAQQSKKPKPKPETFDDNALRRGLGARERQILLAIALRGGLRHTYEIFHEVEAFGRGAAQLLAECAQTRTPEEIDDLKAELTRLRERLGFQKASGGRGPVPRERPGSRQIPVGKYLELTGQRDHQTLVLRAEVVRNDEIELAVALQTPLESRPGESWLARYCAGMSAWEFRTSTVSCDGQRLILNHNQEMRSINRRRFPRVAVRVPTLLAYLPFLQDEGPAENMPAPGGEVPPATPATPIAGYAPAFVESTMTEFAGPGLRIETTLPVQVDDRVLVVFRLTEGPPGASARPHTVAAVGRVRHGRDIEHGVGIPDAVDRVWEGAPERDLHGARARFLSVAVELMGLNDEEIDELAALANRLSSRAQDNRGDGATGTQETSTAMMAAT